MIVQLILTTDGIDKYYGDIPEIFGHPNNYEEYVVMEEDDENDLDWYLDEHFVIPVNELCNSLLGYGDVDYLDANKCKKLISWLEENTNKESQVKVVEI